LAIIPRKMPCARIFAPCLSYERERTIATRAPRIAPAICETSRWGLRVISACRASCVACVSVTPPMPSDRKRVSTISVIACPLSEAAPLSAEGTATTPFTGTAAVTSPFRWYSGSIIGANFRKEPPCCQKLSHQYLTSILRVQDDATPHPLLYTASDVRSR